MSRILAPASTSMRRKTRRRGPILAVPVVVLLLATGALAESTTPRAEILGALERWTTSFNWRNARGACALFAPDLVATFPGVPDRDYAAMCRQLTTVLEDRTRSLRYAYELEEIVVAGDLAVVRLVWTLRQTAPAAAARILAKERGVDVFRRQPDGTWRVMWSMAYPIEAEGRR